jgi:hypothetical protein
MSLDDVVDGIFWIDDHFHLILPPLDEMPSIDYILDKARAAVLRSALLHSGLHQGYRAGFDANKHWRLCCADSCVLHPARHA